MIHNYKQTACIPAITKQTCNIEHLKKRKKEFVDVNVIVVARVTGWVTAAAVKKTFRFRVWNRFRQVRCSRIKNVKSYPRLRWDFGNVIRNKHVLSCK